MRTKAIVISCFLIIALLATPVVGCVGNQSPIASFSYTPANPTTDDSVSFSDSSSDSDGSLITWAWDFGDGSSSSVQNPSHNFAAAGTYVVTLTVTDDGGASDTDSANVTVTAAPPGLDKWDAIEILVKEIIPPAADDSRVSAFMLSEPLQAGDSVSSESGASYDITSRSWLIFIDDNPEAFYSHPTRYVLINARTGTYTIYNDGWPPEVNGYSMWDAQLGKGHLIELWSVLDVPTPVTAAASTAPDADYGDAPDGQDAYYGVPGHFPTLFNTTNSHFGLPGGHTLNVGEETLGLNVSAETDALDPFDPDGMPNLVDSDKDERIYVIIEQSQARLAFTVSVSLGAPDMTRYANALIDFDYSGDWSTSSYGAEWVVVNLDVDVDPGDSETILSPLFAWANPTIPPSGVWMRLALTRAKVDESLFTSVGGWDGSGQFTYGEIEDHLVFLTGIPPQPENEPHWPPPPPGGGNGNGGGGGPPPEPGPETGPCGYQINYLVLIINCGDKRSHIAQGTPIAQQASSSVAGATQGQGYESAGNLGPGNNSLSEIGQAIADLAAQAKCGDHVLIYICGHGGKKSSKRPEGGISIYDSSGDKTGEVLTPSALAGMLDAFDSCKDADCGTAGCCHVSVVIESCYAGNFDIPGLNDQEGMVVAGSSTNTPAQGAMPGGGVYTNGFVGASNDPDADQSDPPNGVDPKEASDAAESAVNATNQRTGSGQQPWSKGKWCECKCPCQPSIDVEKWVWYEPYEGGVKEIEVALGDAVTFMLEIDNDGVCRDVLDFEIVDVMADCLEYGGDAVLYSNGIPVGYRPPDSMTAVTGGTQLSWSLSEAEIGAISPGDSIAIEYTAYPVEPGLNSNTLFGSAHCSYNYDNIVTDQDAVVVYVGQEPEDIEPETVLHGELMVGYQCTCNQYNLCVGCTVTATFDVTDLTQGTYPITNVALYLGTSKVFDSGALPPNTTHYANSYSPPGATCGTTYNFQLVATNSIGLQVMPAKGITTPTECPQQ
jgi:PKD repeat protein